MPFYSYKCKVCEEAFEKNESIANRDKPTKEPCPACGTEHSVVKCVVAPHGTVDSRINLYKVANSKVAGFNDRLKTIHRNAGKDSKIIR